MPSWGSAFDFISLVREMSLDDIRAHARRAPLIALIGSDEARFAMLRALGRGAVSSGIIQTADFAIDDHEIAYLDTADIILAVFTSRESPGREEISILRKLIRSPKPLLIIREIGGNELGSESFALPGTTVWVPQLDEASLLQSIAPRVLDALPTMQIGLARRLPQFRQAVSQRLIREASIGNAKFAAASNIPALIPLVGTIIAAAGDFIVLTKNQMLLLFKLAAVHGRDLESSTDLYLELAPVVGNAFVWRTVARQLVGLVPPVFGAIPKVAIAYAGTFAVGQAAAYYYQIGKRPPREMFDRFYREAAQRIPRFELSAPRQRRRIPLLGGTVLPFAGRQRELTAPEAPEERRAQG